MNVHLGIAITKAAALDPTWTTIHVARAALDRGYPVRFFECVDVEVDEQGQLVARASCFDPPGPDIDEMVQALREYRAPRRYIRLAQLDTLLLRINPLDTALISFALRASDLGVEVVNHPSGILRVVHKGWLATLPDVSTPPSLVTRNGGSAHLFLDRHATAVVVKPAQGSGGYNTALVKAGDHAALDRALLLAAQRSRHVVVQCYVPEADQGEKRLVWMDGRVLGGYLRERAPGEFRHNLKQGASPHPLQISAADLAVVAPLGAHLLAAGIRMAGIDMIGGHIIEVNALNPGGAFHADRLHHSDVAGAMVERLAEGRLNPAPGREACPPPGP